jgi:hypothetical protein
VKQIPLTPDGARYAHMGQGNRIARPFHYRWLLPLVCGDEGRNWTYVQRVALALLPVVAFWYGGFGWKGLFVAAMPLGLAGVVWFNLRFPVLVDLPAMVLAIAAAAAWQDGLWPAAIALALCAGMVKESGPVFAAVYAWNPVLLVGLLAPAARAFVKSGPDVLDAENAWILAHPLRASWKYHKGLRPLPLVWVLPLGVLLCAAVEPSWQVAVAVLLAYGQCAVATDSARLYQWCWPVLAVAVTDVTPRAWWLFLVIVHLANPFKGHGG